MRARFNEFLCIDRLLNIDIVFFVYRVSANGESLFFKRQQRFTIVFHAFEIYNEYTDTASMAQKLCSAKMFWNSESLIEIFTGVFDD